jgi:hypothetical protein
MNLIDLWLIPYLATNREFVFKNSFYYLNIRFDSKTHFYCGADSFHWGYNKEESFEETKANVMKYILQLPANIGKQLFELWNKYIETL